MTMERKTGTYSDWLRLVVEDLSVLTEDPAMGKARFRHVLRDGIDAYREQNMQRDLGALEETSEQTLLESGLLGPSWDAKFEMATLQSEEIRTENQVKKKWRNRLKWARSILESFGTPGHAISELLDMAEQVLDSK